MFRLHPSPNQYTQYPHYPRWIAAALIALAVHAAVVLSINYQTAAQLEPLPGAAPILLDLALMASAALPASTSPPTPEPAPLPTPTEQPVQPETTPSPQTVVPLQPVPIQPETVPQPRPDPKPKRAQRRSEPPPVIDDPAPISSAIQLRHTRKAATSTAPQIGATSSASADALPTWHNLLLAHLERYKRYPRIARQRRQQGIVQIRFSMDRSGNVLTSKIVQSSGFVLLDRSAIAMIIRAQPLPEPPDEIVGEVLEMAVPVKFSLN